MTDRKKNPENTSYKTLHHCTEVHLTSDKRWRRKREREKERERKREKERQTDRDRRTDRETER